MPIVSFPRHLNLRCRSLIDDPPTYLTLGPPPPAADSHVSSRAQSVTLLTLHCHVTTAAPAPDKSHRCLASPPNRHDPTRSTRLGLNSLLFPDPDCTLGTSHSRRLGYNKGS